MGQEISDHIVDACRADLSLRLVDAALVCVDADDGWHASREFPREGAFTTADVQDRLSVRRDGA